METFLSELGVTGIFSLGSCATTSLRILRSMSLASSGFHLKSKERGSRKSESEIAAKTLVVPGAATGLAGAFVLEPACAAFWSADGEGGPCCVGASRFLSVGRSGSLDAGAEASAEFCSGVEGVAEAAGVGDGDGDAEALSFGRCSVGRSLEEELVDDDPD